MLYGCWTVFKSELQAIIDVELEKLAQAVLGLTGERRDLLIEELLDLVLTTINYDKINPLEGQELARLFRRDELSSWEGIKLLLGMAMAAEKERAVKIIKNHGLSD